MRVITLTLICFSPGIPLAQTAPQLTADEAVALAVKQNPRLTATARGIGAARSGVRAAQALTNPEAVFAPSVVGKGGSAGAGASASMPRLLRFMAERGIAVQVDDTSQPLNPERSGSEVFDFSRVVKCRLTRGLQRVELALPGVHPSYYQSYGIEEILRQVLGWVSLDDSKPEDVRLGGRTLCRRLRRFLGDDEYEQFLLLNRDDDDLVLEAWELYCNRLHLKH